MLAFKKTGFYLTVDLIKWVLLYSWKQVICMKGFLEGLRVVLLNYGLKQMRNVRAIPFWGVESYNKKIKNTVNMRAWVMLCVCCVIVRRVMSQEFIMCQSFFIQLITCDSLEKHLLLCYC